jgi:hypothetical protein
MKNGRDFGLNFGLVATASGSDTVEPGLYFFYELQSEILCEATQTAATVI